MAGFDIRRLEALNPDDREIVETQLKRTLDRQLNMIDIPVQPAPDRSQFSDALSRLATDAEYRDKATADPAVILGDYKLSLKELQALRQVAVLSGADVTSVTRLSAEMTLQRVGNLAADVDVSCCSCCCCCCGDTAVAITG